MYYASVIVPVFKRVEQTLKSVGLLLSSTGLGEELTIEVIVVDSTPDPSLKDALTGRFGTSVFYTRPQHSGISANKNAGARASRHLIIIFCESNMEVEPDTLLATVRAFETHPTAAGIGGQVLWRGGDKDGTLDRPRAEDRLETYDNTTYIEAVYSRYFATYKNIFEKVGGYDETVFNMRGEGSDLSARYWRQGFPLVYEQGVRVHHIHDAPDAAAVWVKHTEWGIARDLLLLAYKYDMFDKDYGNFRETVAANFKNLGSEGYYRIIQGIGVNAKHVWQSITTLDSQKKQQTPVFPFKFLEVFSDRDNFLQCIHESEERIKNTIS